MQLNKTVFISLEDDGHLLTTKLSLIQPSEILIISKQFTSTRVGVQLCFDINVYHFFCPFNYSAS